ncbi:hypothetical protein FRB90_007661, partial [Tulasnella sp. 427]
MLTDAPLPPSLPHHLATTHDNDDASTAASSANTPVLNSLPHDRHLREASADGPSPEVPPTLAEESIDHVNPHLNGEDSQMLDPSKAPAEAYPRAASLSGDDMEIDGDSNIESSDADPHLGDLRPAVQSTSQAVNDGTASLSQQPRFTPHSPSPAHSRSRSPNGVPLYSSVPPEGNAMPIDGPVPPNPALQDSQPDDASMADGERPAKRPRNDYEESPAPQPLPSSSSANPVMQQQPAAPPRPTRSVSSAPFTPGQIKYALSTVKQLKKSRDATPFLQPVDPVALNIPHYHSVITHPMDLSTVEKKLNATKKGEQGDAGLYQSPDDFVADVRLIWANCHTFNGPVSVFSQAADRLSDTFERQMAHFPPPEEVKPAVPAKRPSPAVSAPPKPKLPASRRPSTSSAVARRDVASPVASSFPTPGGAARPKREVHATPAKESHFDSSRPNGAGRRVKRDDGSAEQLKYCMKIIHGLFGRQYENWAWFFYDPVDKAIVPGYYDVIKKPMDMNTIKRKLEQDQYTNVNQFHKDFKQIIENCFAFNPAGPVRDAGHKLEEEFNRRWANMPPLRPPEDSEPESEEEDAQSDIEQEKLLRSLEEQVALLNRNIESLKASIRDKKKRRERAREERRQAKLARQASSSYRDSRDDYSYGSKPAAKKGRTSSVSQANGNHKSAAASPVASSSKQHNKAAKPVNKKTQAVAAEEDEFDAMDSPLDMAQKKELSEAIEKLEGDKLEKVISIIQDGVPGIGNNSEEIELEIDALPSAVLQ